jgi:nucleotide-binding universal stress UspA family protein
MPSDEFTPAHILVATDLGPASRAAVDLAIELACALDARLHLLHVVDLTGEAPLPEHTDPAIAPYLERLRARLRQRTDDKAVALEAERARCTLRGISCEATLRDGRVWEGVLSAATNADFVVVGPHAQGHVEVALGALGERLLGSTADRVVRHANRPVWVVPARDDERAPSPLQALLVGVDFSPASERALALAAGLVARAGAMLHVGHVLPPPVVDLDAYGDDIEKLRAAVVRNAHTKLEALAARFPGVETHVHVCDGAEDVQVQLSALARRVDASALVVGAHRRSALGHLVLGSTTERCLRRCTRPVLVVPE